MSEIVSMMVIALFIEATIQIFKPVWDGSAEPITIPEWISMGIGIMVAIMARLNMLEGLIQVESAPLLYLFYILTGIALGRGPSFVHDLWVKLKEI